ncbi:hypothetical protein [Actinoplanes sp. NPDC051859]|uniref:hypothetical protein n=1 Tax=Actinoplanes sp. NPDC051859 TaxID=3363909 RepID=UPI00379FD234
MSVDGEVVLARVGEVTVAVRSAVPLVRDTMAQFYPRAAAGDPQWTVSAQAGVAPKGVPLTRFGVGIQVDAPGREVRLWSCSALNLAVTTRKVVREVFLDACERAGYTMVHASAIYTDEQVVMFAADKRGGKTTLALRAVLEHDWRWLSNDHLILLPGADGGLVATSLPTPIPVKAGTLVDLWEKLPTPWDANGFDIEAWRRIPRQRRYAADDAGYFTFAQLEQPNPVMVPLAGKRVSVVFPRYAAPNVRHGLTAMGPVDTAAELAGHLRTDWLTDDLSRERHLPFEHRDPAAFALEGVRLTDLLTRLAGGGWHYEHRGDPGPLLNVLAGAAR